jgi:excinuclease ABC subunit C
MQMRQEFESESREILTNVALELPLPGVTVSVPQIGDKRKLLELALKNVLYARKEKESMNDRSKDLNEVRIMETIKKDLRLTELPKHIECFDNSNFRAITPWPLWCAFAMPSPARKTIGTIISKP